MHACLVNKKPTRCNNMCSIDPSCTLLTEECDCKSDLIWLRHSRSNRSLVNNWLQNSHLVFTGSRKAFGLCRTRTDSINCAAIFGWQLFSPGSTHLVYITNMEQGP